MVRRRGRLAGAFAAILLVFSHLLAAAPLPPEMTLGEYRALLKTAEIRTAAALSLPPRGPARSFAPAVNALRPLSIPKRIRQPDGPVLTVDPLIDPEEVRGIGREKAAGRTGLLQSALDRDRAALDAIAPAPVWHPPLADVARRVRTTADSPEFRPGSLDHLTQSAQRILEAIAKALNHLLGFSADAGGSAIVPVVTGVLFLLICTVLAMGVYFIVSRTPVEIRLGERGTDSEEPAPTDPHDALERAQVLMAQGESLAALRLIYRAGLLRLDQAGVIRLQPGMTNREAARRVQEPKLRAILDPATRLFDDRFYHLQSASMRDCEDLLASYHQMENAL